MNAPVRNRHIIVIGASAGGVEALQRLAQDFRSDLPAAVFIVLHVGAASHLAAILDRAGTLPAANARSGDVISTGRIYVAPPGLHMLLHDDHLLLRRGPRENLARPAIDPLFRSAASSFGARVIGVVLSGSLSDGTAGLRAIKRCGGVTVVQDPRDAAVPDMPANARRHTRVDHSIPLAGMADLLHEISAGDAGKTPEIPMDIKLEAAIAAQELVGMDVEGRLGTPSGLSCPECHGALWEIADGDLLRYRCHVGHAYGADIVLESKDEEAERTLWTLLRSHQERAALARRMAARETRNSRLAAELERRANGYDDDARLVIQIMASESNALGAAPPADNMPGAKSPASR